MRSQVNLQSGTESTRQSLAGRGEARSRDSVVLLVELKGNGVADVRRDVGRRISQEATGSTDGNFVVGRRGRC